MTLANKLLSGIELDQNTATSTTPLGLSPIYQEFYLPADIERGTSGSEIRIPELTGFSVLLKIPADAQDTVSLGWTLERDIFGIGWITVASGKTVGAQATGDKVWFDIYYDDLVVVDPEALSDKFRISITGASDIEVWHGLSSSTITSINEDSLAFRIFTASGDEGIDFLGNQYRGVLFRHNVGNVSVESNGDRFWFSKPNPSRFAIENLYFDVSEGGGESIVDSILIDPITPNVYFHIYYTNEGSPGSKASEWDDKLWTRVSKTFRTKGRETHILPDPIAAKYIKVEFSHLQAKPYDPGVFQQPIFYQKYPKWVLDYFLIRQAEQDVIGSRFVSSRTEVRYNALDLAYNYYLDDLKQEPDSPVHLDTTRVNDVKNFFQNRNDISDEIDNEMAQRINTTLQPYGQGLSGLIGERSSQVLELSYTEEPISTVSSLNRDAVVFEQDYPVMFFYLTSRHRYREVSAMLTHNRAYFVGIRQIAFLRERYTKATDTNMYVEVGGDSVNLVTNDFVRDGTSLVIS